MSHKFYSISTKVSSQDNVKIIRIQSNKNQKSHNNLINPSKIDPETLSHQNIQMKSQINSLSEEVQAWKLKYQQLQRDSAQNLMFDNSKTFLISLKQQLKKLESDFGDKIKQIEEYKKMINVTKYQELQVELFNYQQQALLQQQEINDLKEQLKEHQNLQIEGLYQKQEKTIQKISKRNHDLKLENINLKTERHFLTGQIESLKTQLIIKDKEIRRLISFQKKLEENQQHQNTVTKTRQQIFRESLENAQLQEQLNQLEFRYSSDIKDKDQEISDLKLQLFEQGELRKQLEKFQQTSQEQKINLLEIQKVESRQNSTRKLKISLNNSGISQQQQNYSVLRQSSQQYKQSVQMDLSKIQNTEFTKYYNEMDESEKQLSQVNKQQKKVIRVNLYDVTHFGLEIKFKLLSKEFSLQDIEMLFEKYDQQIKIHELLDLLLQDPFKIQSYDQRKLIARYLVEDNNEDYVVYDALKGNDTQIVLSVFKQLIGKYELFTKREINSIENELKVLFERSHFQFNDQIQQLIVKKKHLRPGQCEKADFEQAIKFSELNLSPRQLEYIYFLNYTFFQDLQIIYYQNVMTYFNKSK
ncbi:unnamed protein product (macronuclear) [Paramecium tetraurelia]|uniref:EF-hand domain-containing protein n=1 Tax=Paramecium tetraurelia TaxID=5888 RepID=A0DIU1_PARTE|nr:uncharacterized protein GSPATT00017315001 [Paramecium tetraurelia]CAK82958.1 unnamed protein product [Paramecium tetraurelia]|eukprot:XP_001450355.1 hypothetical protein (macronuclear) [Paramecium tetraurelia strain d4-2]